MCRSCRTIVGSGAGINLASMAWHLRAIEQARGARYLVSRRRRVDGVSATSRHRDAVGVAARKSTRLAREPRGSSAKADLRGITHEERLRKRVRSFIQTSLCFCYLLVPI